MTNVYKEMDKESLVFNYRWAIRMANEICPEKEALFNNLIAEAINLGDLSSAEMHFKNFKLWLKEGVKAREESIKIFKELKRRRISV